MKQSILVGSLLLFLLTFLGLLGAVLTLWQNQETAYQNWESEQVNSAQATLVQVMGERQGELSTRAALESTRVAQIGAIVQQATAEATARAQLEAQVLGLQTALTAVANNPSQPNPQSTPDLLPQLRLQLTNPLTVRLVGEPIELIAAAAHPDGIIALNIAVNGETILVDSPAERRLHTVNVRWTPSQTGRYEFTALALNRSGRSSEFVSITVEVINSTADLNEALREQIQQNVADLRGITFLEPVEVQVINTAELEQILTEDFSDPAYLTQLRQNALSFSLFDFLPRDYDPEQFLVPFYTTAIAGFYEPDTDEMYVISEDGQMSQEAQLTLAHELMHALQDQHFQLGLLPNSLDTTLNRDQQLALRSLGEGEAELVEFLYKSRGYLTGETLDEADLAFGTPEFANLPDFLVSEFTFPYARGFDFVYGLYQEGGFAALDEAWEKLPQSTEQILHPEKYTAQEPPLPLSWPDVPAVLGSDWQLLTQNALGEFYIREHLGLQLDRPEATTAAAGWGADAYHVYQQSESDALLLVWQLHWDTPADQEEFTSAYTTYLNQRTAENTLALTDQASCWSTPAETFCLTLLSDTSVLLLRSDVPEVIPAVFELFSKS